MKRVFRRHFQTQSLADMHLSSLQREQESRFSKNMRNFSTTSFAPMQREGFQASKWAGFFRPTGYKPMIILFFLFLIQQFSGIYITLFYAVTFMQVKRISAEKRIIKISMIFFTDNENRLVDWMISRMLAPK